ncbi:agmatine/peptidylarginine deiminase [Rhodococcus oryzae]|uniref:agmatine/peptidylarginine deiminase n=1 Tax=Rhodococcus oryzae TaxID=2571143 RepID=UPI003797572F
MQRRRFIQASTVALGGLLLGGCDDAASLFGSGDGGDDDQRTWVMPEEGEPHKRTWMAFGASEQIWGAALLPEVRRNLATIAQTIAQFEPVSMLVRPDELDLARELIGPYPVELLAAPLDDLWMRDTGPVFVKGNGTRAGIDFNFNGWGEKQDYDHDARVANFVSARAGVESLPTDLILEGGGIEVDGEGTAIITESCVLNNNRNPGWSKADVEAELGALLGLEKIIWLPGIAGKDITDGHTDFYARFARQGVVVAGFDPDPESFDHDVTARHLDILETATDTQGRSLEVVVLEAPSTVRPEFESDDFAAGYINFYVCNGAVIAPEFGDPHADGAARQELERLFPDRRVVQIDIDAIAAGGGGIHCTTQQEPAE